MEEKTMYGIGGILLGAAAGYGLKTWLVSRAPSPSELTPAPAPNGTTIVGQGQTTAPPSAGVFIDAAGQVRLPLAIQYANPMLFPQQGAMIAPIVNATPEYRATMDILAGQLAAQVRNSAEWRSIRGNGSAYQVIPVDGIAGIVRRFVTATNPWAAQVLATGDIQGGISQPQSGPVLDALRGSYDRNTLPVPWSNGWRYPALANLTYRQNLDALLAATTLKLASTSGNVLTTAGVQIG